MRVAFSIKSSSAIARGLREPSEWQAWAAEPQALVGELSMDLSHVPAMARRRLGPLAKMAVVVADDVLAQAQHSDLPVVWVSRYGDSEKSLQMLRAHVSGDPLSPTAFALSVHNGVGAQYSILRGHGFECRLCRVFGSRARGRHRRSHRFAAGWGARSDAGLL